MVIRPYVLIFCLLAMLLGMTAVGAQDDATCSALQNNAFTQTGTQCADTGPGMMCYGHPTVTGVFDAVAPADFFSQPGDEAELAAAASVTTGPADTNAQPATWGTVLLNVQANLPTEVIQSSLGGRGVIYLLPGGLTLTNDAGADPLTLLDQGIAITNSAEADLRVAPMALDTATSTNVIARVPAESQLSADAITPDGDWVRVLYGGQPGWISRAVIDANTDLSQLVVIGPDDFTPMQAVTLATAEGDTTACGSLLSGLFVQGPDGYPVDVRINGVDVRISSTVLFTINEVDGTLEMYVVSGTVTVFPNDPDRRVSVPPGFKLTIRLSDFSFVDGGDDTPYRVMTEAEMDQVNQYTSDLPPNVVYYQPPLLDQAQPSGAGQAQVLVLVIGQSENDDLAMARQACADGDIPAEICEILGL